MTMHHTVSRNDERAPERTEERRMVAPYVDIFENADEILLMVDLPGVERENVAIDLEKNELRLSAKRKLAWPGTAHVREVGTRDYERTFRVPQGIDAERISAELTDGVLRLRLPKSAALKPRRIDVKAG